MICPKCSAETQVIDSRDSSDGVRRRRTCVGCKYRFTTYERVELPQITVVKRGGDVERFDDEKIRKGISISCKNRPISSATIDQLTDQVVGNVYDLGKDQVQTSQIGEFVQAVLRATDEVAYLRFTSVWQSFANISQFEQTITNLHSTEGTHE